MSTTIPRPMRRLGAALAGAMLLALVPVGAAVGDAHGAVCEDVPALRSTDEHRIGADFRAYVDCMAAYGITVGYPDGGFRPGLAVNRQQMALFITRFMVQAEHGTTDVPAAPAADHPDRDEATADARAAIDYLAERGVVSGYADGTYRPHRTVSRQQMASFVVRALEELGVELPSGADAFDDVGADDTHAASIRALAAAGIVGGYADGTYRPSEPVTRQQMSRFIVLGAAELHGADRWNAAIVPPTPTAARSCDRVIPRSLREVDQAQPGEVLCLEPGVRGELRLFGLRGTAQQPITVVNDGGVVDIQAAGAYAGIEIRESAHLRITGTGVTSRCGAGIAEDDQACGIRISGSDNGLTGKVRTEELTVDHVEVGNVHSSGLGVHDKTLARGAWVQRNVAFRDLYVHDIATEGHYHGSSSYTSGEAILLDGVEIVRNLVVRTGRDGIQVGSTPRNCLIADNEVRDTGRNGEDSHAFGIIVNRGAACDLVGNRVEGTPRSGIYDQGLHGQLIADNVVIDSGEIGINVREGNQAADNPDTPDHPRSTHILRNRVDGTGDHGIQLGNAAGTDNRIHDNHLSRTADTAIDLRSGVRSSVANNTVE